MSGFYTTQSEKMPFQVPDKHVGWEHTLWLYTCSDGQTSSGTREPVSFPAGGVRIPDCSDSAENTSFP